MKTLLKGGTVVRRDGPVRADLLLCGEKIEAIGPGLPEDGACVVDVSGRLLLPGFIDAHTHFDLDVCGTTTADDFYSGTSSAILGGTTAVIDFACPNKGETLDHGLNLWHKKADGNCACDYGFHMTVDDWNETIRGELPDMFRRGVSSFKMYMTYPAMMLDDESLFLALKEIGGMGGVVGVHCEESRLIDALTAEKKAAGENSPACHPQVRPARAEAEAVRRLLDMAAQADVPVVIVHLSAAESLAAVEAARCRGQKVYVETCPQYLLLDDGGYDAENWLDGAKLVCAPPLRKASDRAALWQGLENDTVQTVATDHCSFTPAQKLAGREDFTAIPGGLPGAETRGILLYQGVCRGEISLRTLCRVLAENPARLYGLYPRKGVLEPGSDGDIVVLDPTAKGVITAAGLASRAGYTPFEGMPVQGRIEQVYLRGTRAVENGMVLRDRGGEFLFRSIGSI